MSVKIQVVLTSDERDEFRRCAARAGKSLSSWLRDAARRKAAEAPEDALHTAADLDAFFAECDARWGEGRETDWEEQKRLIAASQLSGLDPET